MLKLKRKKIICINCLKRIFKKDSNYCGNCGYPTSKLLNENQGNASDIIKHQLVTNPECANYSIINHGMIETMHKMGYMSYEQKDTLINDFKDTLNKLLENK